LTFRCLTEHIFEFFFPFSVTFFLFYDFVFLGVQFTILKLILELLFPLRKIFRLRSNFL
jgi:hypothetical protein